MPEDANLDKLLKRNPHIEPKQLRESAALTEAQRHSGVSGVGYRLASTGGRRRAQIVGTKSERQAQKLRGT